MSNFSVTNIQDSEGFVYKVKIQKAKKQNKNKSNDNEECFICKKCKIEYRLDLEYLTYLKSKIEKYEKRTICQKCKNLVKVSRGETPIPLRPDQEWPANQQKPCFNLRIKTFADVIKKPVCEKPVCEKPVFFQTKEEKIPNMNDKESWPTLPKKEQLPKQKEVKKFTHVVLG